MNRIYGRTNKKAGMAAFALTMLTLFILTAGAALPLQAQTEASGEQAPAIVHNSWSSGAPMPTALWAPGGVGVLSGLIYVVGGCSNSGVIADTQIYNPTTNSWSSGVSLPTADCDGVAAVVKGILYVIGGTSDGTQGGDTNAVWAFNPSTKTWSAKSPMPTARSSIGVAVENNIIYVAGGNSSNMFRLNTVESYNPATDTWKEEAPLVVGKSEPSVGLTGNKTIGFTIVAADGFAGSGDTGDNEGYNATTNVWSSLKADPTPRNAACAAGIGTKLFAAGGYSNGTTSVTEKFTVSTNTWKTLAPMPQAVLSAGSAAYKGRLYCYGGVAVFQGTALNNLQIYQP